MWKAKGQQPGVAREKWRPLIPATSSVAAAPVLRISGGMYAGGSMFLIAIGAILYWAVTFKVTGVNVRMVGLILMAIGVIGLLFSLIYGATTRHRLL